jgi:hypothetical protein
MRDFGEYDDWSSDWQETWDDIPGVGMFREHEYTHAMELFETAFMHHSDEPGYDKNEVADARAEFFDYTGLPEEMFPWDEWREAMGYDD